MPVVEADVAVRAVAVAVVAAAESAGSCALTTAADSFMQFCSALDLRRTAWNAIGAQAVWRGLSDSRERRNRPRLLVALR
jgi:hypothetical protein